MKVTFVPEYFVMNGSNHLIRSPCLPFYIIINIALAIDLVSTNSDSFNCKEDKIH